jgi:hypothetical protein
MSARFPEMKMLDLLRHLRPSCASNGNAIEPDETPLTSEGFKREFAHAEQQSASSSSTVPPPPYRPSGEFARTLGYLYTETHSPSVRSIRAHRGTPVLIADGWKIYYRGISWKIRYSHGYREEDDSVVCGDLLLGIEPPDGLEINSKPMMNPIPS